MGEVRTRFVTNDHRQKLFAGFGEVVRVLGNAGCSRVYLDGSFVTDKAMPKDFDGCWDAVGVDASKIDPVLLDFKKSRAAQKQKYCGEMFIANFLDSSGVTFLDFFQTERSTGQRKGIIGIAAQGVST